MECSDTLQSVYTYEPKPVLRRPRSSTLGSAALHSAARAMSTAQPATPTKLHTAHLSGPHNVSEAHTGTRHTQHSAQTQSQAAGRGAWRPGTRCPARAWPSRAHQKRPSARWPARATATWCGSGTGGCSSVSFVAAAVSDPSQFLHGFEEKEKENHTHTTSGVLDDPLYPFLSADTLVDT